MTGKIKLACLGGALNSAVGSAHMAALRLTNRFELSAGCFSRQQDVNSSSGAAYGLGSTQIFSDLDTMLAHGDYDAAVILTPTNAHFEQVKKCIIAGVPVICEKSLASNSIEAAVLARLSNERRGYLSVIYNYTGFPMLRELRALIRAGKLGSIGQVQIEMPQDGFLRRDPNGNIISPQDWRLSDCDIPMVSLDLGIHLHIIIYFLTGKSPLQTIGNYATNGHFKEITDSVSCMIEYTDGMQCDMWFTKAALGNRNGLKIRVFGEFGSAEWMQMEPEILRVADDRGDIRILDRASANSTECNRPRYARFKPGHPSGFIEAFANYYDDLHDSLLQFLENKEVTPCEFVFGAVEAREGLALFEAVHKSVSSRNWVNIDGL
jgi:predicted dehydrogenase